MKNTMVFKTPGNYYLYDRNTNLIVAISKNLSLYMSGEHEKTSDIIEEIDRLKEIDVLQDTEIEEIIHPATELLSSRYDRRVNTITLQITQQCNLRCSYCVYSGKYDNRGHSTKVMDLDTAKKSIDFLIRHSVDADRLHIAFYGGEPLLMFDFIKDVTAYAKEQLEGKIVTFGLTTNGTLINKDIAEYFFENDFLLTISLDGDQKSHDKNRKFSNSEKGSFDKIIKNLEYIKEKYPDYFKKIQFNIVLDPSNGFKRINDFFLESPLLKDEIVSAGIISDQYAKEELDSSEEFLIEYGYELFKVYLSKLNILDKSKVSNLFDLYFSELKNIENRNLSLLGGRVHHGGPCVPGLQRLFVNTEGNLYPCERVNEESEVMRIGTVFTGFNIDNAYNILNIGKLTEEECKNCFAFRHCTMCAAAADDKTKLSKNKKIMACDKVRKDILRKMKNYCLLKEFGYHFEK